MNVDKNDDALFVYGDKYSKGLPKKANFALALITAVIMAITLCLSPITAEAATKNSAKAMRLHVKGTQLMNSKNKPIQLKGVSTHGLAWYPQYVNKKAFKKLRDDWHVNTIRLALYTEEYGGYTAGGNKKELKALIDKGVKYTKSLGMYCIIDWHILSDGNPMKHQKAAKSFFKEMAKKYGSYGNVIYEICNEPNGKTSWNTVRKYANNVIPVIRKYDENGIILVGTPTWSQDVDKVAKNPVKLKKNVMYTAHFYAATHKKWNRDKIIKAIKAGTPVFISEFSITEASGNGKINYSEAKKWKALIKKYKLSRVGWSLSNKSEESATIKKSCKKTSGWSTKDLTAWGKWLRTYYRDSK